MEKNKPKIKNKKLTDKNPGEGISKNMPEPVASTISISVADFQIEVPAGIYGIKDASKLMDHTIKKHKDFALERRKRVIGEQTFGYFG